MRWSGSVARVTRIASAPKPALRSAARILPRCRPAFSTATESEARARRAISSSGSVAGMTASDSARVASGNFAAAPAASSEDIPGTTSTAKRGASRSKSWTKEP